MKKSQRKLTASTNWKLRTSFPN